MLYVFRTLVNDDIPLNAGCLKPLRVIIPDGSMLSPHPPASVVAGNFETSTCMTDALAGQNTGGNGGIRRVRFLEGMTASILSNGQHHGAFGLAGGAVGLLVINRVERADGRREALDHIGSVELHKGGVFVIETPGGGGYGAP